MLLAALMGAVAFQKGLGVNHLRAHAGLRCAICTMVCQRYDASRFVWILTSEVPEKFRKIEQWLPGSRMDSSRFG